MLVAPGSQLINQQSNTKLKTTSSLHPLICEDFLLNKCKKKKKVYLPSLWKNPVNVNCRCEDKLESEKDNEHECLTSRCENRSTKTQFKLRFYVITVTNCILKQGLSWPLNFYHRLKGSCTFMRRTTSSCAWWCHPSRSRDRTAPTLKNIYGHRIHLRGKKKVSVS